MREHLTSRYLSRIALGLLASLVLTGTARAGKVSWLDDVVRSAVREAEAGAKVETRGLRSTGRLFAHEAEESLEGLARRSDDLARGARKLEEPAEVALRTRFARLTHAEPEMARTFAALAPAERRLVVEMGETAQSLARRYPGQAEGMIKKLGVEGMSAVRAYGDDVAEVIVKEGPESVNILRKTGRGGWRFYTHEVLTHKKQLAAAGVLGLFLASPERFVDTAGRVTEYAVQQFAHAGLQLAGAVGGGAARGLETAIGGVLARYGLDSAIARRGGMILAGAVALLAAMVMLGLPVRWLLRPITWPVRAIRGRMRAA
ncbi:MAG: hypothetical protein JWN86_489 [Planctomycetota bacterium]|nr:hypothetical protein [Planctomycetota bacterium]